MATRKHSAKKVSFDEEEHLSISVELEAVRTQTQLLMQHVQGPGMVPVTLADIFMRLARIEQRFDAAGKLVKAEVEHG